MVWPTTICGQRLRPVDNAVQASPGLLISSGLIVLEDGTEAPTIAGQSLKASDEQTGRRQHDTHTGQYQSRVVNDQADDANRKIKTPPLSHNNAERLHMQ